MIVFGERKRGAPEAALAPCADHARSTS